MAGIYDDQILGAKQQADLARKLRENIQDPQGQMVSGWYVPPSITQYLGNALKSYNLGKQQSTAQDQFDSLTAEKAAKTADLLRQISPQAQATPTPDTTVSLADSPQMDLSHSTGGDTTSTTFTQPSQGDVMNGLAEGLAVNPTAFQGAAKIYELKAAQDAAAQARQEAAQQRADQIQAQQEFQANQAKIARDENFSNQQSMAKLAASLRPSPAEDSGASLFSPAAIDAAAQRYNMDGTLPPMGMGKSGGAGRSRILNRAAELASAAGIDPADQRGNQLQTKANASALTQLQKQQTMISAFEKNAQKNADMALEFSDKADRTGTPIFNLWLQAGQKGVQGNPDVSAFNAANETFVNEYAKIMSGSMGNTPVSDSARAHAHEMLSTAMTKDQYEAVIGTLRREMKNRMDGMDAEKQALMATMHGSHPAPAQPSAPDQNTPAKVGNSGWTVTVH